MSEKMTCPACDSHASKILMAFTEGRPCPVCEISAEVATEILEARARRADAELTVKYEAAMVRAAKAEAETALLRRQLAQIQNVVNKELKDFRSDW